MDTMSSQWIEGVKALDAQKSNKSCQEQAQSLDNVLQGLVITDVKKEDASPEKSELSGLAKELKAVIDSGGDFASDSAIAARFYRDLKGDPKLKEQKKQETKGKGQAAIKAFKVKWAALKLKKIEMKQTKSEEVVDLTKLDAEYCTVDRMWSREGGTPAALETCKNYCVSALKAYEAGELFYGHPMTKYDDWRKRIMVR